MKKINGHELIERDYVGEIGDVDGELVRSACNAFFARRGISVSGDWHDRIHREQRAAKAIKRARGGARV